MELIRSLLLHRRRPSPDNSWVGSCINSFVACSAFTHVTTYRLAKSPYATLYTGGSGGFVASTAAPIATGWSDPVPGRVFHPAVVQRLSRRTVISVLASEWSTMTSPPYGRRLTWLRSKALTPDLAEVAALPLSAALRHAAGGLHVPAAFALLRCSSSHCAGVSHMNRNAWLRLRRRSGIRWRGKCTTLTSCSHPIR